MRTLRMLAVGTLLHAKHLSRSPLEITIALLVPVVQATLAVYLFRSGAEPHRAAAAVSAVCPRIQRGAAARSAERPASSELL